MEGVTCFCLSKILCNGALLSAPSTMSLVKNCGLNNIRASCRWRALFIQFGEDMMCFSYRGGGWSTICSRKLKVSLFFFFNISNLKAGTGGGGGTFMSLYRESQKSCCIAWMLFPILRRSIATDLKSHLNRIIWNDIVLK